MALKRNRSMPTSAVIPVLGYEDVGEAVDWLCAAFGFTERWRAGDHRAQLNVGDGAVAITQRRAGGSPRQTSCSVVVRVADADAHHARARSHGARVLSAPADHPYGERQYTAQDLGGHVWTFSESIADVAPEAWGGRSNHLA
ncbi:MAG TPA: VOC family protein [Candidatus Limnocylindria bacterium]|nr:VOC family protein [Candidatus Limnocylindria bacterium]